MMTSEKRLLEKSRFELSAKGAFRLGRCHILFRQGDFSLIFCYHLAVTTEIKMRESQQALESMSTVWQEPFVLGYIVYELSRSAKLWSSSRQKSERGCVFCARVVDILTSCLPCHCHPHGPHLPATRCIDRKGSK